MTQHADPSGITITTHDEPPPADADMVDQGISEANAAAAPLHEVWPLGSFARDAAGTVIGGAVGRTWGECAELRQLWVEPSHRGQGIGRALVRRFEEQARSRGCRRCYLDTFSFQAPGLYRALGYVPQMQIAGFAPGVVKYTMLRELTSGETGARTPCSPSAGAGAHAR